MSTTVANRRPRPILRTAVVLAAVAGSVAFCEALLRLQEPFVHAMERRYNWAAQYVQHPVWNHQARPSAAFTHRVGDMAAPFDYVTNSLGLRDSREFDVPKPAGVTRVLVMGDSFTEGYFEDDTLSVRLERRLNGLGRSTEFQVVNAGCPSYSPLLHYLRLKYQLANLQPDFVILNVDLTDVYDDYRNYRPLATYDERGEPLAAGLPRTLSTGLAEWLEARTWLARVVFSETRVMRAQNRQPFEYHWYHTTGTDDSEAWRAAVGYCLSNIARLIDFCATRHIAVTVTTYPHRYQLVADPDGRIWHRQFEKRVRELAIARGAAFFSAHDGIAKAFAAGQVLYWTDDMHFTPLGQRTWADLVADHFQSRIAK